MSNIIIVDKSYMDSDSLNKVVSYILYGKHSYSKDNILYNSPNVEWGGIGINLLNPALAVKSFQQIKSIYHKENGNQLHHFIISLCKVDDWGFAIPVNNDETNMWLNLLLNDLCDYVNQNGFQLLFGIHRNTDKLHIHCVMNSINYSTGLRLNNRQGFYETMYQILKSQIIGWQWKGVVYNDYKYE